MASPRDKTNECGRLVSGIDAGLFTQLIDLLQVHDPFSSSNRIKFSWDNRRRTGLRVLARLDRIYSFKLGGNAITVEEYYILGNNSHSNHLPMWYKLALQPEPKRKSAYKMSSFFLKNQVVKENFKEIWESQPQLGLVGKMHRCLSSIDNTI